RSHGELVAAAVAALATARNPASVRHRLGKPCMNPTFSGFFNRGQEVFLRTKGSGVNRATLMFPQREFGIGLFQRFEHLSQREQFLFKTLNRLWIRGSRG